MALDLSSMCRTCLESDKSCMIPLFDNKPGKSSSVFEMFQSITSIKAEMTDGLPEKICIACFTEINRAYSFKIKCEASEQTLRQLLGIQKVDQQEQQSNVEIIQSEEENKEDFEPVHQNIKSSETDDETGLHEEIVDENMYHSEYSDQNENEDSTNKMDNKSESDFIFEEEEEILKPPETNEKRIQNTRSAVKRKNIETELNNVDLSVENNADNNEKMHQNKTISEENCTNSESDTVPEENNILAKKKQKQSYKCQHCPTDFVFLKNLNKHLEWHKKAFETQMQFKKGSPNNVVIQNQYSDTAPKEEIVFETSTIGAHGEEILTATTIDEIVEESAIEPAVKDLPESCSFSCENCGAGFQTERSLNFHRKLNRCMEKQFECLVCHKIFISKVTLIEHIKIHTENFQCSKCMKEFESEEDYKTHMDTEHVTGKTIKNQCPVCKKCFTMLSALKDHMRVHSGEKPFICETCGRGFSQSTNLKQHTMRHSNTKPFKCAQCPCDFVSKGELNSHMRKHTGEHPFVCDTCGSGFTTSSSLKKHIRIHTGERPYACEFCPMRFAALGTLKNHRRTHTGEKPYLCRFCGRGFAQQSDRVTHERTHTGERPYVCSVCGSAFQQNGALKIHMKLHAEGRNSQSTKKRKSNNENENFDESSENLAEESVSSSGAAAVSSNGGNQGQQSAAQNNQNASGSNRLAGTSHQHPSGSGAPNGAAGNAADWNPEECDRFSFDDSDRFEEDSLCSWSSEPESVCNNWRGWKRPSNNTGIGNWVSQKKQQESDQVTSLTELAAKCVASFIPFELVEHVYPPVPEQLQLRIAFWSFPDNEEDIRLYSCLANSSADEFHRGDQLFRNRAVRDPLQIGFHLSASVISQQPRDQFNVAVTFDRRRISSCNCTCTSSAYWCSHVVAVCLHRIHCPNEVCLRAPVSESLTRLQRDQLQKFAQYLISELPQQILPTAQRLLDELLSSQPTAINTVCGAPDPTAGASANDQTSWYLDEKTLHENIKRILIKFCLPAPIVFSDVNYLTNSAPPAAAEWSSLLRPLRGREPEGMWNLLSIVREMYRRCDRNAVRLLEIITEECMACDQILIWWFYTKLSLLVGTNGHGGGKHSNTHSNSNASQHACASLCDEIVVLWRLAALNPGLAPDERDMLHAQFTAWHLKILDRVVKCGRMQPPSYSNKHQQNSRSDAELFIGFKPAIEACYLDWEDYPITGITHTQETNPIYYSPFTCFKHSDTKSEFPISSSQVNSTQATLMATQNKHYNYISTDNQQSHHHHSIMKARYERPLYGRGDRSYVSSSNNSSNSSSDSMNILIKTSTHHHTGNAVVSNMQPTTSGLSHAIPSTSNINIGNGNNLLNKNSNKNKDGNRSSASSEGFCENEDFGGDSSGNNIDGVEGRTLQPSCLKSQTAHQVMSSVGDHSNIVNNLKSPESESDSQASVEISSSSSCKGATSMSKISNNIDKDVEFKRSTVKDNFDFISTPESSKENFMTNSSIMNENNTDENLTTMLPNSKCAQGQFENVTQLTTIVNGKSVVTVTEVNKLLTDQIRKVTTDVNEEVLTTSQMTSSSSSSSSSASSVSGSISSNALTADTSGGNGKQIKAPTKDHRRQLAKDEFLSSSSDEFTANEKMKTQAVVEKDSQITKTASDISNITTNCVSSEKPIVSQDFANPLAVQSFSYSSNATPALIEYKQPQNKSVPAPVAAVITVSQPTAILATSTVPQYISNLHYSQYVYHRQTGNSKQQIFSNLRPTEDAWDILLARAEGLHAHGHGREACILAVRLAEEMLTHPPNLMIELPMPPRRKGKKQNINPISHQLSVLASTTLSKCVFLCTVLAENSEHYHLAFRICLFALEMPRPPASTKPLEVKLANQEADLLALLKKIPLNQPELRVIRERAEQLRNGTLKSRGEALLPINLASFIFDALVMPSIAGKENRNKVMSMSYRIPTDENLGCEAAVAALGLKANVSEAEHPLLCEGTRRQRGDLALTLLYYYKDEPRKIAKIMEKLLDREIHILLKQPLLPAYYSNNPPVRTPTSQTRREYEHEALYASNPEVYSSEYATATLSGNGGGNSRPHSSTSAELEIGMNQLNISSPQTSMSCPIGNNGAGQLQTPSTVTGATSRSKDIRYKGKRAYPSIPNQPSEASAHFMFELSKNVLTKAGGTSSTSLFTQATTNQNHHGPHRGLHMCAFQLGVYALGLHNCVSPNWLSRTYSSHVSWIIGQAMEIGAPAISFLIDTWEGHLTPPEAASMADRASKGWDNNMVYPAAELALSVLPHAAALNPNEIQRAISQCKEQSDQMLERACITVETAAKGGGVYPEVLFQVAHYWYELYLRNTPNSEREEHDINDVDHSVSLSALIESQAEQAQQQQQQQQVQQPVPPPSGMPPNQQVVVTTAPPPFQQGVTTIAPIGIGPYGAPYSFCQGIYHHHNISYPGNQMQMYITNAPPQPYQYGPQPPQPPTQQQPNVTQVPPYAPPGGFGPMQHPPPPPNYGQPMGCQTNGPVVGAPPPGQPGAYGQLPPQMQVNTSSVPPPQMQQSMQYYGQSMALLPPPPQVMVPQSQAQQSSQQQANPAQAGSVRGQPNHHGIIYPLVQQPSMQRQRHPHQFTQTQLRYLLAAYNVGMLAMETLARRVHDDRPQAKYARNPPYGEDVKWLLRISKKLGTQYLHQFCICAVNSIVSPFVLHDVAIESAHYLGRNNPSLVMQHLRSALTPLVQKCQQMYIQCIHQKLYHLTQADYEEFASIILAARAAFQITPEGNAQFKDWLQSIKRSKSCKKDLWAQINTALQSNSK